MSNFTDGLNGISSNHILLAIIIIAGMLYSILTKKLTIPAACTGGIIALLLAIAFGFIGVAMMTTFFLTGSLATSWKADQKKKFHNVKESRTGRMASQVLANAGVPACAGLASIFYPGLSNLMLLVMAAAFASATSDTLSSELGMVYGRKFFNVITLKADDCGMDGVISLEGTLLGVLGSSIIGVLYAIDFGFDIRFVWIILAGTAGNLIDSVLGALLERKALIGNDGVNFLNTLSAGIVILLLSMVH